MSVELKIFGGAYFPKDKALKKSPDLKPLVIAVRAGTKAIAEAVIFGRLAAEYPECIDDYFKVKIWEVREGLPCPAIDEFTTDFFETVAVWNTNAGEPAHIQQLDDDNTSEQTITEEMKPVRLLDQHSRAACLALFGPVEQITAAQYGQVVDLINDDAGSFTRELAEALTKETRALDLAPERQEQLLAWVREKAGVSAQWPDIKKLIAKWIDTPADKREQATSAADNQEVIRTDSGARLCTGAPTDRHFKHSKEILGNEIALGVLAREHEFNIYSTPGPLYRQAETIRLSGTNDEFNAWYRIFITTPGGMDFSRAINIAIVKTAPPDLWKDPVKHREYFNRVMTESNHANPDPLIIDIACGRSSSPMPGTYLNQSPAPGETDLPVIDPGRAAQLDKELDDAFSQPAEQKQQIDEQTGRELAAGGVRSALTEREIVIKALVEAVLNGKTNCIDENEAQQLITGTGQSSSHLTLMITMDIFALENGEEPEIIDDYDVQYLGWNAMEEWSDNPETRLENLTRILNEYRQEMVDKSAEVIIPPPVVASKPTEQPPETTTELPANALTYHQQLTIAALQGLCANPAHATSFDDIADMAVQLAAGAIRLRGEA